MLFSIIIPLYNKAHLIENTLKSVLAQSCQDFEIVIVNDGSTDGSVAIVESFSDPRIRLFSQQNAGVSAARNRGINEAQGKYIALLDADDLWHTDYLKEQKALIEKYPECRVFAANYSFLHEDGTSSPTIVRKLPFQNADGILSNYFQVASCSHPPIWTSAVVVEKEAIKSVGGFPLNIKSGEDLLTWARLACCYKIAYTTKPLATFVVVGYYFSDKPTRTPEEHDYVGAELLKLWQQFHPRYFKQYLSLWHKMRASIYLRSNKKMQCFKECGLSLKFNILNFKIYAYIILNLLPLKLTK